MQPITRLTVIGITLPVGLFVAAVAFDVKELAVVALTVALVSPALGHVVYRRTFFTRGTVVRLLGGGLAGMLVIAARGSRDLGAALGMVFVFGVLALVAFIVGAAFDVADSTRARDRAS